MTDTEPRLRALIAEHLCVEPEKVVAAATFAGDLKADSLDAVEMSVAVEEEFGIVLSDDEALDAIGEGGTVGHLIALIDAKRAEVPV